MDSATSRPGRRPRWSGRTFTGRQLLRGGSSISGDRGCGFLVGGGNPPSRFWTEANSTGRHLDARRARLHAVDGGAMGPYDQEIPSVVRGGRPPARGSDGGRYRQLCRHPGKGPLDARLDSQHGLGIASVLALRRQRGVVLEPISRVDLPASALSAGVFAICPGLVCRPANAGRRRYGQATGYPRSRHALRHACAVRLLAEGLTVKEIGDHLGHRSTSATSTYAKVNMAALREVGAFDLGDVL